MDSDFVTTQRMAPSYWHFVVDDDAVSYLDVTLKKGEVDALHCFYDTPMSFLNSLSKHV